MIGPAWLSTLKKRGAIFVSVQKQLIQTPRFVLFPFPTLDAQLMRVNTLLKIYDGVAIVISKKMLTLGLILKQGFLPN